MPAQTTALLDARLPVLARLCSVAAHLQQCLAVHTQCMAHLVKAGCAGNELSLTCSSWLTMRTVGLSLQERTVATTRRAVRYA